MKQSEIKYQKDCWDKGEWDNEPDYIEFEYRGIKCEIKRNHFGNLCGYICIFSDNPWYEYDDENIELNVHGGITYQHKEDNFLVIGFDCGHMYDITPFNPLLSLQAISQVLEDSKYKKLINHGELFQRLNIYRSYKNISFVEKELKQLVDQILDTKPQERIHD